MSQPEILLLTTTNTPKFGFERDKTNENMGINQTKETEIWVLPRQTDQNMDFNQTEQTETWVLAGPIRPKYGCSPNGNMSIGQTETWVSNRPNRPKLGYCPERTLKNIGVAPTEQSKIRY